MANDEAAWARAYRVHGIAPKTIANPAAFPGGSPVRDQRYFDVEQRPIPEWMTPDPAQQPGGPPLPQPSLQIFPPWERPPKGAQLFGPLNDTINAVGAVKLPAGAGSSITIPGVSYLTPNMMISVVRLVTIYVINPTTAFNAT